ncbi:LuxR C-terminal-related transcriptional regulator [Rhodococcus sp. IEGM 1381]|uniref:helix-turn-helix transcriptional regulator n=1 Tax=Rhodococcus sp. IEGM 1381 TaxID=3047085 RepID=UPI0024B6EB4F|nr:LuxR C-terminal-related transcriptional regulator [Rhodococcus sp. IEGM 1381]MDI9897391.1 LuxR C-terminal-related transcriptional regulator [Rhodococcus sp. IEGM 1381]
MIDRLFPLPTILGRMSWCLDEEKKFGPGRPVRCDRVLPGHRRMSVGETSDAVRLDLDVVDAILGVCETPADALVPTLSTSLGSIVPHSALFVVGFDGHEPAPEPPPAYAYRRRLTLTESTSIRERATAGGSVRFTASVGGAPQPVLVVADEGGALLIMTDPGSDELEAVLPRLWHVVVQRVIRHAEEASPDFLRRSRSAAGMRATAVCELADQYMTTLQSLLGVLRSVDTSDRAARRAAIALATEAASQVRTVSERILTSAEEPVATAFERLRTDLHPVLDQHDVDVQFVVPPLDGRALPSEIAHGARAVVRCALTVLVDRSAVRKVRVQWDCDGRNLLIDIRDDGNGDLSSGSVELRSLQLRVAAMRGQLDVSAVSGWGSTISVVLPLDPPGVDDHIGDVAGLSDREREVLDRIVAGGRSRSVAAELGISENTVKFHLSRIYRKMGIHSRSELAALMRGRADVSCPP